jgi:hypothetical protein
VKKRNLVPPQEAFGGASPAKAQDRAEFMEKWLAYGFHLKNRADAHGVDWRGKTFETWEAEIVFAEEFARPDRVME